MVSDMTDEKLMKVLECCANDDCGHCPTQVKQCRQHAILNAIDLINRQKTEIERYKENMPYLEQQSLDFCGVLCDFAEELIAKHKSEAIKEFAEMLKEGHDQCDGEEDVPWLIDKLVKEMTEETKHD